MVQEEKSMMKKKRGLFILAGALVALLAGYFRLQGLDNIQDEKENAEG